MCAIGYNKIAWTYHCDCEIELICWGFMLVRCFQASLCLSEGPKGQFI